MTQAIFLANVVPRQQGSLDALEVVLLEIVAKGDASGCAPAVRRALSLQGP